MSSPEAPRRLGATAMTGTTDRSLCRWVVPADNAAWTEPVISEWSLTAAGWEDHHPHTETVVVIEGELYVESGSVTVVLGPGEAAIVPAGTPGRYWAPVYARMLSIYGPNPEGLPTPEGHEWLLPDA